MQCATCHTEIADNALICFRCGASTTDRQRAPVTTNTPWPLWLWAALVALLAVAVVVDRWLDAPVARIAAAALFGSVALAVWWRQRRRAS